MKKYILLLILLIIIDVFTKLSAAYYLGQEIVIIPSLISLLYVENIGIAFSIPITGIILKILTLILIFGIFWYYWKHEKPKNNRYIDLWYVLIFAGALWNAWERIFRGYVTDFISVEHFAVFNLADSYISLWACLILYFYFKNA